MLKEFREFILRGNLVDLAVAVVIGTAFTAVVTAFVTNIVTPIIAAIGGKPDFSGPDVHDQRQRVRLRRVHQRADRVPDHRRGRVLLRHQAGQPAHGALSARHARSTCETRACPECLSDIPIAATRCAFCTRAACRRRRRRRRRRRPRPSPSSA